MALLRYRTGDHVVVKGSPCACGRPGRRIRVLRRADDLTKIRGVLCAKNDLADAVRAAAGAAAFKIRIYRDENEVDRLAVHVAFPGGPGEEPVERLRDAIHATLKSRFRVGADHVEVLPAIEIPRTVSGKPIHVLDERPVADESSAGTPAPLIRPPAARSQPGSRPGSARRAAG
jgi:phenylacetate-CoA ligase